MNILKSIKTSFVNSLIIVKENTFLKDGLSIDETKVSAMVIMFIITVIFALTMYGIHGDITINLLSLLSYLIFGITGVNAIDKVMNKIGNNSSNNIITPIENSITPIIQNTTENINNSQMP